MIELPRARGGWRCILADPPVITEEWLSGFCDGEASLNIAGHGGLLQPRFRLNQRDDDGDLVRAIRAFLGVGGLHVKSYRKQPGAHPQLALTVVGKDCRRLVEIFDVHPLRSKKRFEYPIWREAVMFYSAHPATRWTPHIVAERHSVMSAAKERLQSERVYRGAR